MTLRSVLSGHKRRSGPRRQSKPEKGAVVPADAMEDTQRRPGSNSLTAIASMSNARPKNSRAKPIFAPLFAQIARDTAPLTAPFSWRYRTVAQATRKTPLSMASNAKLCSALDAPQVMESRVFKAQGKESDSPLSPCRMCCKRWCRLAGSKPCQTEQADAHRHDQTNIDDRRQPTARREARGQCRHVISTCRWNACLDARRECNCRTPDWLPGLSPFMLSRVNVWIGRAATSFHNENDSQAGPGSRGSPLYCGRLPGFVQIIGEIR